MKCQIYAKAERQFFYFIYNQFPDNSLLILLALIFVCQNITYMRELLGIDCWKRADSFRISLYFPCYQGIPI